MPSRMTDQFLTLTVAVHQLESGWRRSLGVSAYEMLALSHLRASPLLVGELGSRIALSSGAMTGLVDRLVVAGLVERMSDPADGRRKLVGLTEYARGRLDEVQRPLRTQLESFGRALSPDERVSARHLLDALTERLGTARIEDPWNT